MVRIKESRKRNAIMTVDRGNKGVLQKTNEIKVDVREENEKTK